jgi:GDP-mannose transporter
MVSATTYTLVGVVNKFLTVLLNVVLWDKHSTAGGILSVLVCLLAGTLYQQAPRRDEVRKQLAAEQQAVADLESSMGSK